MKYLYNISPVFLQNFFCTAKGFVEKKRRFGGNFSKYLSFLKETQWYTEEKINEYQIAKVNSIIKICNDNVPYYKKMWKNRMPIIQNLDDLKKIPILTKEDIHSNYESLRNSNFTDKYFQSHTSGTTGKSLSFLFSIDAIQYRWALWFRHRDRFGIKPNDSYATFTGLVAIPLSQIDPPYWRENRMMNQTIFTMHHINLKTVPHIVKRLNSSTFKYYSGYPSILYSLATLIEDLGLKICSPPNVIFTGAETLLNYQREKIQKVFNCLVTDQYGFSEGCGNASRCEYDNYHEDFEYGILECETPQNNIDGSYSGDIIATGFTNLVMPLIRYRVGDTATWIEGNCNCGRKSKVLQEINGRNEDFVQTPEGNKILRFDYLFKDTSSIYEAQIIQYNLYEIIIRIVKRDDYNFKNEKFLTNLVHTKISPSLKVFFEYVPIIERDKNGKFRAVRSFLK